MKKIGLSGPGNDYKHQIIISYVIYALMDKFATTKKYKSYIPFPEFSLKPESAKVPDIAVWKTAKGKLEHPVILIEICWPKKVNDEITKLTKLMENNSKIAEAFVIDKESYAIRRINRTKAKKPSMAHETSKIESFKIDLSKILNLIPVNLAAH